MTSLFKVSHIANHPEIGEYEEEKMHPTQTAAKNHQSALRKDGISSTLTEIELKKTGAGGLSTKELLCALFHREGYVESAIPLGTLAGIKGK